MTKSKLNIAGGKLFNKTQVKLNRFKGFMGNQNNANAARAGIVNKQQRLSITTLSADAIGTKTAIAINAIGRNIIKNNDKLCVVCPYTGSNIDITVSSDVSSTGTSIPITSADLYCPSGSYIMYQEDFLNYYIRGGTITQQTTIANADYKTLFTSPITLVAGITNMVMIPINLLIITDGYSSDDENNNKNLYCGHGTSITLERYWGRIPSFNYRERSNTTWNMTGDTGMIMNDSISGDGINLYSNGDFESDDFSLKVYLTYRVDSA